MSSETPNSVVRLATASVLLVEDSDDDALFMRKDLEQGSGYAFVDDIDVVRVESLADAIDACDEQSFDAVFLDLGLPDSNGVETVSRFTEHEFEVPIIVLTGLEDSKTALEAIQQGAQNYLVKGESTPEAIVRTMRHAIERKKNERKVCRQRDQMAFFNSLLRHDMLNGMDVIQTYSRMLAADLDGEQGEHAETVVKWSDNIVDLTEKIRDTLDTLTSEETTELIPVVVEDVLAEAVTEIEGMRNGVTVSTECPPDVAVLADDLFADVLRNLLVNAVEHTKPEPVNIEVTVEGQEDTVRVVVADDGSGVPDDQKTRIFDRGKKNDSSTGSGFGLYFVDAMVDTYDGSIRVEDNDPEGARFVLELPRTSEYKPF